MKLQKQLKEIVFSFFWLCIMLVFIVINSYLLCLIIEKMTFIHFTVVPESICLSMKIFLVLLMIWIESRIFSLFIIPKHRIDAFKPILEAFKKISKGEFDVTVSSYVHSHYGHLNEVSGSLNEMAQSLKKMEELRQEFISTLSHEIQSPLTSIQGFSHILLEEDLSKEKRNKYLSIIDEESKRLSHLSDNLLKLTRLDAVQQPECKTFSLKKQIQQVILNYELLWTKKKLKFILLLEDGCIKGDPDLLIQVWNNLLHNSIKFSYSGKTITVTASFSSSEVTVSISDEGIGLLMEDQLRIFERFYKADKSRNRNDSQNGNGLGLAIVKKIIELHKGKIDVYSQGVGKGTMFSVVLPIF